LQFVIAWVVGAAKSISWAAITIDALAKNDTICVCPYALEYLSRHV